MPKNTDYFIDCGMDVDKVKELVQVGNPITREREFIEMGDCVNCKVHRQSSLCFYSSGNLREFKGITI